MELHEVRVYPSRATPARRDQLAWKIAEVAADPVAVDHDVAEMVINRIIDDAAVAIAAVNRDPVAHARAQALAHPRDGGATVFGLPSGRRFEAEWAGWANSVAVRELDFHDSLMATDYSHPGDTIPPLIAVAQQCGRSGSDLVRAVAAAYEIQVDLVKAIDLHSHRIDHVAHLGPAVAAGLGTLLALPREVIYQAVQQAVHLSFSTRQSRKGEISSWKAYAPAHTGKVAVEAVDRAMRGEGSPSPIYEGEDSVIAWMLAGKDAVYRVPLPALGETKRAILETYPKVTAVICRQDYQAIGVYRQLMRIGKHVPDDTAVVGNFNLQSKLFLDPGLTSVSCPSVEGIERAMEFILNPERRSVKDVDLTDKIELVVRGSTVKSE